MEIKKIGVVGCGQMGSGIAIVCALCDYEVVVSEINQELLDKGLSNIRGFLEKGVQKGKYTTQQVEKALSKIHPTTDYENFKDCDLVIEAATENMQVKLKIFETLDKICKSEAILASNTSSLSITKLASVTKRPQKVIGIHFMNPVPIMKLVEIVKGLNTDESTYRIAKSFAEGLGKVTITAHDNPGFIINYLLIPYLLDAIRAYENGIATKEDIDTGMKLGCGLPMGPLELADFIGLDTTMYIADAMYEEYREPRFAPPVLLRRMVTAGLLGRKSGKGFYDYSQKK